MFLLLFSIVAHAEDTTSNTIVEITFEEVSVSAQIEKPSLVLIRDNRRPEFERGSLIKMFIVEPRIQKKQAVSKEEDITNFVLDLN